MCKKSLITFVFDGLYNTRKYLLDNVVYYSFIFYGFEEIPFRAIDERSYRNAEGEKKCEEMNLSGNWDLDPLLKIAELEYRASGERHDVLKEKCREIRLFCALIIGVIGLLVPKFLVGDNHAYWVLIPVVVSVLFVCLSVAVLLVFWDKMSWSVVRLDDDLLKCQGSDLKVYLIKEYHLAAFRNDLRIDYLADVVKVARFYFMLAFAALAFALITSIFKI